MAQLSKPSIGQPLDVSYIGTMVEAINTLDTTISSQNSLATSKVGASTATAKKTSALTFAAETVSVRLDAVDAHKVANTAKTNWTHQGITFSSAPIVVGTIVSSAQVATNKELVLVIKSVSTTETKFEVIAVSGVSQSYDIFINFLAIGLTS